ncbi:hypothetical protein QN355_11250 [Cryobacterium sp. 10S3]|uniref:hypothetical protein n=1 Tax=Cryobacterium sp. 10S3 TaxID=3048582 RepID=UPI002AC9094F|nr:hypothetical protein [Cryobacterium sp. 10S3]MEB0287129.1 hypothetical protein [Cryobacterium sp. 10S3]WPX12266.1 hypothetical protein RHM57_11290 [Cryobacterium sp. 10S3]
MRLEDMPEANWRDEWPEFRVRLVDETSRCLADQQAASTDGQRLRWDTLTSVQRGNLVENLVAVFIAQDQAMQNLIERGLLL